MPNGRSGGFLVETAVVKRLVRTISETTAVGQVIDGSPSPRWRSADAAELARLVEECPHERLAVEEQDYSAYVIRLAHAPQILWLCVDAQSPLFSALRQQHEQWKIEHPNWTGWVAF